MHWSFVHALMTLSGLKQAPLFVIDPPLLSKKYIQIYDQ